MPRRNKAQVAEEAAKCYELKLTGASDRQIAQVMTANGSAMTHGTVQNRIKQYMEKRVAPAAEEYRQLIIDRVERLLVKCEPGIKEGDPRAIANAKGLYADLFKYNGLESLNVHHSGSVEHTTPFDNSVYGEGGLLAQLAARDSEKAQ